MSEENDILEEEDVVETETESDPKPKRLMTPEERKKVRYHNVAPIKKKPKKKTFGQKLKESLFGEDIKNVPEYMFFDVVIPALKKNTVDLVNGAVNMALFGNPRSSSSGKFASGERTKVTSSIYSGGSSYTRRENMRRKRLGELIFESKDEAEYVIDQLQDLIDTYGSASIEDLNYILGEPSSYTDANWGWTNLRGASAIGCSDGWALDMPTPKAI